MAEPEPTGRDAHGHRGLASLRGISQDRTRSFRLIVSLSIFVFVLLYIYTVRGVEAALDYHFAGVVQQAAQVIDLQRPVALQIQDRIEQQVQKSPWVRIGGVRVTVIVIGQDGTYIYVGGRALPPPPSVDLSAHLREAQRILPVTYEVVVSVPHNALLSNGILLIYAALLLQGLFMYHRSTTNRDQRSLDQARRARDNAVERSHEIERELTNVRDRLQTIEPGEEEHSQEIRALQFERESLQRKVRGLAAREEQLRGKAERATELDQERQALEELLEEATSEISSRDNEIGRLQSSLKKADRGSERAASARERELDQIGRRLRALYRNVEFDDRAIEDLVSLRDESMKLKAEASIKKLCDEAENVSVRRKVGGLPDHLTIFELGFAGKGRLYYTRGRTLRFRVLVIGAKNSQKTDLEYLSRLPKK